jgi:hypothetical protein
MENALSGTAMLLRVRIMLCRVLISVVGVPQLLGSRWIQKMGRYIIVPGHPKQWELENREGGYYSMRYYTTAI